MFDDDHLAAAAGGPDTEIRELFRHWCELKREVDRSADCDDARFEALAATEDAVERQLVGLRSTTATGLALKNYVLILNMENGPVNPADAAALSTDGPNFYMLAPSVIESMIAAAPELAPLCADYLAAAARMIAADEARADAEAAAIIVSRVRQAERHRADRWE